MVEPVTVRRHESWALADEIICCAKPVHGSPEVLHSKICKIPDDSSCQGPNIRVWGDLLGWCRGRNHVRAANSGEN